MEELLFKLGIPTHIYGLSIKLPDQPTAEVKIGDVVPQNVGLIYGLSIAVNGTMPNNNSEQLITNGDATELWLSLKYSTTTYIQRVRLSNFIYDNTPLAGFNPGTRRYYPCNIPVGTNWSESFIENPRQYTTRTVLLNIHFIDKKAMKTLLKSGAMLSNGQKLNV